MASILPSARISDTFATRTRALSASHGEFETQADQISPADAAESQLIKQIQKELESAESDVRCLRRVLRPPRQSPSVVFEGLAQLGAVELGGWHTLFAWSNPPPAWREPEIAPFPAWLVWHLLISPRLECYDASASRMGAETYRVRLVVHNTGWLPTYVTKKALERQAMRGIITEITLPDGATLAGGSLRQEHGQLEGRAYKRAASFAPDDSTNDRLKAEWIVHAPAGGSIHLLARHERAGVVRAVIALR